MTAEAGASLRQALSELEAFAAGALPLDHYVENVAPVKSGEKSFIVGYPDYQPGMDALWAALFSAGVGTVTAEAYNGWLALKRPPLESAEEIVLLKRDELLLRLFTIRRAERFCDGYWTSVLRRGLFLAYARRLLELGG